MKPFAVFPIDNAVDVVRFSFLAHRAITYLDLSTCEYTNGRRFVNTEEGFKKHVEKRRRLLYDFHLDIFKEFDNCVLRCSHLKHEIPLFSELRVWKITVSDGVYQSLVAGIVERVNISNDKLGVMSDFYCSSITTKISEDHKRLLEDFFVEIVMKEYLIPVPEEFAARLFSKDMPELLDLILNYAQKKNCNIWCKENEMFYSLICDVVNGCMFFGTVKNVNVLLKYRDAAWHNMKWYLLELTMAEIHQKKSFLNQKVLLRNVAEGFMSTGRNFLLLQVIHAYIEQDQQDGDFKHSCIAALRSIWRSIPEAYISISEWSHTFRDVRNYDFIIRVCEFYLGNVCDTIDEFWTHKPRSLAHLCRTSVRKILCGNNQLPSGITRLHLPKELESYLRLEY